VLLALLAVTAACSAPMGNRPISTAEHGEDAATIAVLAPYRVEVEKFRTPIGNAAEAMENKQRECALGSWIADVMREACTKAIGEPADIAFTNAGGIRSRLPEGPITRETLLRIAPFDNRIVVYTLDGEQTWALLVKLAADKAYFPASNIHIEADRSGAIQSATIGGEPFDKGRSYRVATNDFVAIAIEHMRTLPEPLDTGLLIRDELEAHVVALKARGEELRPPAEPFRFRFGGLTIEELEQAEAKGNK
jgi:2',3'-cyclic-nucleotide 2'-phosphodiesterase (5'-nucleotidase family)